MEYGAQSAESGGVVNVNGDESRKGSQRQWRFLHPACPQLSVETGVLSSVNIEHSVIGEACQVVMMCV